MPRFDARFDDLAAFAAVVRAGSFTRAAAQLGVSPSALSHAMRTLEERLALKLLHRTTRSVAPTEAGQRLFATVGPRLQEIEAELATLAQLRGELAGSVRISANWHAMQTVVWPRLQGVLAQHPGIRLEVSAEDRFVDIVAERFDLGVRLGQDLARDMIAQRITPDVRMAVVGAPAYWAHQRPPRQPPELAAHRCIGHRLPTHGGLMPWEFERNGQRLSLPVQAQLIVNSGALALQAALQGHGLAWLPLDLVQPHLDSGALAQALAPWAARYPGYHLYYASRNASAAVKRVADALRQPDAQKR